MLKHMAASYGETKPGIYTTEFWLTMFSNLGGLLNLTDLWHFVPNKWCVIALAIINALYAVSRGQAKKGVGANANVL